MDIAVQWVRTGWTRGSQDGPAAKARAAVPIGFTLPDAPTPFTQIVSVKEADDFRPRETYASVSVTGSRMVVAEVPLREEDGRLIVQPPLVPFLLHLPHPRRRPRAVSLAPGQWLRWQLHYRYSTLAGLADWTYRLDTLNLAYGPTDRDAFLGAPTQLVAEDELVGPGQARPHRSRTQ